MTWEPSYPYQTREVCRLCTNQNAEFELSAGAIARPHVRTARHDGAGRASKSGEPMSWPGCFTLPRCSLNRPLPAAFSPSRGTEAQALGHVQGQARTLPFCSSLPNSLKGPPAPIGGSVCSVLSDRTLPHDH